jgi:hypothetical protein
MSNDPPEPSQSPEGRPKVPRWFVIGNRVAKLLLTIAVVWVGWSCLRSMQSLLSERELPARHEPVQAVDPVPRPIAAIGESPEAGFWTFAGCECEVGISTVPAEAIDRRLAAVSQAVAPGGWKSPADEGQFFRALRFLTRPRSEPDGRCSYAVSEKSWRLHIVSQMSNGAERFLAGAIAFPRGDGQWNILEMRGSGKAPGRSGQGSHLLPVPCQAQTVCSRRNREGEVILEVLALRSSAAQVTAHWREQGWQIHDTPSADPTGVDCICEKAGATVYAWGAARNGNLQSLLLCRSTTATPH